MWLLKASKKMNGSKLAWRGFGDSEVGPLHNSLNLPNQDAYHLKLENDPVLIAVSDGLGSKPLSHLGAQAVNRAVKKLAQYSVNEVIFEPIRLIEKFHSYWLEELCDVDIDQCRCTALFAIVFGEQVFIAQLGDGDCCIISSNPDESGQQVSFLADKDDDLFSNQTHSLGNKLDIGQWQYCFVPTVELEACFLATDGIADDLALAHRTRFYVELLNQYRQFTDDEVRADVRNWISQWPVAGHSDDKTIVALFR